MTEASRSAIVLPAAPGAERVVGGLPLASRMVLALRVAGVADPLVLGGPLPAAVSRSLEARGAVPRRVDSATVAEALPSAGAVLVVAGDALADRDALEAALAIEPGGHLVPVASSRADGPVPAVLVPVRHLPALLAVLDDGRRPLGEALERAGAPVGPPRTVDQGLLVPFDAERTDAARERALLDHLRRHTAAGDSYLAALIDRRFSRPLTRLCLRTPLTPSAITLLGVAFGIAGGAGLATVSYGGRLVGVLALIASVVLDCVDGEVARARLQQSAAGARLDVIGDYLVHAAAFVGLGVGLARQGLPPGGGVALLGLVTGVGVAMGTVHALFVRPALTRGQDLHWRGDARSLHGTPVAAVIEKVASRDYTYLLLVLAIAGHLEWFLYAAAVGSWGFVAGVLAYRFHRGRAAVRSGAPLGEAGPR